VYRNLRISTFFGKNVYAQWTFPNPELAQAHPEAGKLAESNKFDGPMEAKLHPSLNCYLIGSSPSSEVVQELATSLIS